MKRYDIQDQGDLTLTETEEGRYYLASEVDAERVKSQELIGGVTEEESFNAGRDAGLNGVNDTNCHFRYFASPALTAAWERGKKAASA